MVELIHAKAEAIPEDDDKCLKDTPQGGTREKLLCLLSSGRALEE
jgi:hypothetical protein